MHGLHAFRYNWFPLQTQYFYFMNFIMSYYIQGSLRLHQTAGVIQDYKCLRLFPSNAYFVFTELLIPQ